MGVRSSTPVVQKYIDIEVRKLQESPDLEMAQKRQLEQRLQKLYDNSDLSRFPGAKYLEDYTDEDMDNAEHTLGLANIPCQKCGALLFRIVVSKGIRKLLAVGATREARAKQWIFVDNDESLGLAGGKQVPELAATHTRLSNLLHRTNPYVKLYLQAGALLESVEETGKVPVVTLNLNRCRETVEKAGNEHDFLLTPRQRSGCLKRLSVQLLKRTGML